LDLPKADFATLLPFATTEAMIGFFRLLLAFAAQAQSR